jgi:hypothetical protein
MGLDGHALYCMANCTDQFDRDLKLVEGDHQVDGIGSGIAIKGVGTFHIRSRRSEEVSADDQTVKAKEPAENASSEHPDMSKIGRAGPLTFDPCPDSTHVDQHIHVPSDKQAELMHWLYCLGHLSFTKLKALARIGEIPKHLANVLPPVCAGCAFGAMTRVPWRNNETTRTVFKATKPGQCVSVDQMISTQVGFYAQLKGSLTKQQYRGATIFVDHFSGYKYIHLMTRLSSEETVAAQRAFKQNESELVVVILHYHADNDRFCDNAF